MSRLALIAVSVAVLGALLLPAGAVGAVAEANELERPIVRELNRARAKQGLRPLRTSAALSRAAEAHALSMARRGYFSHTSADGTRFDRRIARAYSSAGMAYWTVGENLLWASPTVSPERAVRLWMASPGHRRNILSRLYRDVGIAAVRVPEAPGVFGGREITLVVTTFGARR